MFKGLSRGNDSTTKVYTEQKFYVNQKEAKKRGAATTAHENLYEQSLSEKIRIIKQRYEQDWIVECSQQQNAIRKSSISFFYALSDPHCKMCTFFL